MKNELVRSNRPVFDYLHPLVYKAMAALALLFALSAWAFFSEESYTDLALVIVSFFLLITTAIPYAIWRAWLSSPISGRRRDPQSFHDWAGGEFETWQGRLPGGEAVIQILLPLMAVAFGLALFGLVFRFGVAG